MKKMNLLLAACLFVVSLNAQLLSVSAPKKLDVLFENTSDVRITKMNRAGKQLSRISIGETVAQIVALNEEKKIIFSVLNATPNIKFSIEDETGAPLFTDKMIGNKSQVYSVETLPKGVYTLSLSGNGFKTKRYFTVANGEISMQDDLGFVNQKTK
jgi:hypothetical protein